MGSTDTSRQCWWRSPEHTIRIGCQVSTIDVVIPDGDGNVAPQGVGWRRTQLDLARLPSVWQAVWAGGERSGVFKIVLPEEEGFETRENLIAQRLRGCKLVKAVTVAGRSAESRTPPKAAATHDSLSLPDILPHALAVLELAVRPDRLEVDMTLMEAEIANRLSLPLLQPTPVVRRTLALLEGRPNWKISEWIYFAAQEMKIDLIVLDREGHWVQDAAYAEYRTRFIPIDMTIDDDLAERVVKALDGTHVDGVISYSDLYLIPAAEAAGKLRLPTPPVSLFETCRDKYLTRMIQIPDAFQCLRVEGPRGIQDLLDDPARARELRYPLIVKPCAGSGSEGVSKVNNERELREAAARTRTDLFKRGDGFTLETYVDGPEIDGNFVVVNGLPVFYECADQWPVVGDAADATALSNFLETDLFLPTGLPNREQAVLRQSLFSTLQKLGVRNGVYHMEARVQNSAVEYADRAGIVDLRPKQRAPADGAAPECILIENNCRPPNMVCTYATSWTHGVDYYALHQLFAVGDLVRAQALAQPFLRGAQFHLDCVMLPITRSGVLTTKDAIADFAQRHPEVIKRTIRAEVLFQVGDKIPDPADGGALTWMAYFIITGDRRQDVIEMANVIRAGFSYSVA